MIHIKKVNQPPELLKFIKENPKAHFDDTKVKDIIRTALLKEQGYLCAYCMSRIKDDRNLTKIEHYVARNDENELDYKNLLAVCKGNEGEHYNKQHCDTRKGSKILHIDPKNEAHMQLIKYEINGKIVIKDNETFQDDVDKILNLNCDKLKGNRMSALRSLQKSMRKTLKNKGATKIFIERALKIYLHLDKNGERAEYCGILIDYLKKRLER